MTQASEGGLNAARDARFALGQAGGGSAVAALGAFILYEAIYFIAYRQGMSFSHAAASPFWFPDSVLLCALLLAPRRWWWLLVLGPLPIRLLFAGTADVPEGFLVQ